VQPGGLRLRRRVIQNGSMSSPVGPGGSWSAPAVGEAARYLSDTAPGHGGRNARPLALPALAAVYCSGSRTAQGASAALLGVAAGGATWFGLAQLAEPQPSIVLAVVSFVVAAGALVAASVQATKALRTGRSLVAALRRWHAVAPEVPVHGTDALSSGPGLVRLVLALLALVAGLLAFVGAVAIGTTATWLGLGLAAVWLLGSGAIAAWGWSRVRALLRSAAPQTDQGAFAPAHAPAATPAAAAPTAAVPQPSPQQWAPRPDASAPWAAPQPPHHVPATTTWQPAPEPVLGDTKLAADTTMSGRTKVAVVLDDGRQLEPGAITLVGRDPQPRADEPGAARLSVLHPTVSKTHASFRVARDSVHVTDRASTNGTTVIEADGSRRRLRAWTEERVDVGDEVLLGSYRVRVIAAG
jgi:pSer/pThr/pTyr-binding forkhead associated (FHA) protein